LHGDDLPFLEKVGNFIILFELTISFVALLLGRAILNNYTLPQIITVAFYLH